MTGLAQYSSRSGLALFDPSGYRHGPVSGGIRHRKARSELAERGIDVSEVFHRGDGPDRISGPDPQRRSYASFASFTDPDGNGWLVQEVTARLPGRVDTEHTTFNSSTELAAAFRRAAAAHGEHEKRNGGQHDENWPDWYAEYIVREQAGKELPL